MRRASLFVTLSALVWLVSTGAFAQERPSVLVAKVDGSIDRTVASYLEGAIEDAEDAGSTLVVQLDSAGTLDQDAVTRLCREAEPGSAHVDARAGAGLSGVSVS